MRIQFETGGGVAGPAARRACDIDVDRLPPEEAAHVKSLVHAADLPAIAERLQSAQQRDRPDDTYYELTVHDGDQSHDVSTTHRGMPTELRPLVQWLSSRAVPGKGGSAQ